MLRGRRLGLPRSGGACARVRGRRGEARLKEVLDGVPATQGCRNAEEPRDDRTTSKRDQRPGHCPGRFVRTVPRTMSMPAMRTMGVGGPMGYFEIVLMRATVRMG